MTGRHDANLDEARRWLRQAQEHLASARWSAEGRFWAPACFQCQHAAELALKAVLIRTGERAIMTHGVLGLVRRVEGYHPSLANLADPARRLDRFYIPTRYPNGLPMGTASENFVEEDFQTAISAVDQILQAAEGVIEGS